MEVGDLVQVYRGLGRRRPLGIVMVVEENTPGFGPSCIVDVARLSDGLWISAGAEDVEIISTIHDEIKER